GDDAAVLSDGLPVHLGNHQRDSLVQAEGAAVVDDHGAGFHRLGRPLPAGAGPGAEERDVDAAKRILVHRFDHQLLAPEGDAPPRAPGRRQEPQGVDGKLPLLKEPDELGAHGPGSAQDRDVVLPHCTLSSRVSRPVAFPAYRTARLARWIRTGCSCLPARASATVSAMRSKSATQELGLTSGLSWPNGTK